MRRSVLRILLAILVPILPTAFATADKKPDREEGVFHIRFAGDEIGTEKFVIAGAGDTFSSTSLLDFRNPGESHQRVQMETRLDMTGRYVPTSYSLKSDVDGKKGSIVGVFTPNQAMFEYTGNGATRKAGVLVGNEYTLLDSNIFHHFIFLVRLFQFDSKEKQQKFEVVIPQETDSGILTVSETGRETITVGGKKRDTRRLQVDSGSLVMQLWVDSRHFLYRSAVPAKQLEIDRD